MDMHILKKNTFLDIWALFQKWLPRPNHSAHVKGIKILCKTAVSMSRDVSSESKSIGANYKYSSPAGMSTWTFRICPFHIFFTLFSHVFTFLWNMLFLYAQYRMDIITIAWAVIKFQIGVIWDMRFGLFLSYRFAEWIAWHDVSRTRILTWASAASDGM